MNLRQKLKKAKKEIERLRVQHVHVICCRVIDVDPFDVEVLGDQYVDFLKQLVKSQLLSDNFIRDNVHVEEHTDIYGQKSFVASIEIVVRKD